jgi:hypothetical protein
LLVVAVVAQEATMLAVQQVAVLVVELQLKLFLDLPLLGPLP